VARQGDLPGHFLNYEETLTSHCSRGVASSCRRRYHVAIGSARSNVGLQATGDERGNLGLRCFGPNETRVKESLSRHGYSLVTGLIFLCLLVIAILLLKPALDVPASTKNQTAILGRTIAVTGSLTAAAITLVGILFRHSVDLRTTKLAEEAERRLRLEAAMQTVRALATDAGDPAPIAQASAALLVLGKLDQLEIAMSLASEMWPKDGVTTSTVMELCDSALASSDKYLQRSAASLLLSNPSIILAEDNFAWPAKLQQPNPHRDDEARRDLLILIEDLENDGLTGDAMALVERSRSILQ
jgi:hypothetical protein